MRLIKVLTDCLNTQSLDVTPHSGKSSLLSIRVCGLYNCTYLHLYLTSFPDPKRRRRKGLVAVRTCA